MIHPEPAKRLSIQDLIEASTEQTNWLNSSLYQVNGEREIGSEMYERIHSNASFLQACSSQGTQSTRSDESTTWSDLDMSESESPSRLQKAAVEKFTQMPEYEHFSFF
jgi:hypothetical protein